MSEKRPLALRIYCALLGVLILAGTWLGVRSIAPPPLPTILDVVLAFAPIATVSVAVWGLWSMRWWSVALFWLCVLSMIALMFVAAPGLITLSGLARNAAIWSGLLVLPPTAIALVYRRRFS